MQTHTRLAGVGSKSVSMRDQTPKVSVKDRNYILVLWFCSPREHVFFFLYGISSFFFGWALFRITQQHVDITCYSRLCYIEENVYYNYFRLP